MKLYLDVSCLNRPFDDQTQARIHLESEAVLLILERLDRGEWAEMSSDMAVQEVSAITNVKRRERVHQLLPESASILKLTPTVFDRSAVLVKLGARPADAVHVAAAEVGAADVLLSCDDRLCRWARRHRQGLKVIVANPLDWLREVENANS